MSSAKRHAADAAEQRDPAGQGPRAGVVAGAERGADQRLRGDGERVEHQRGEEPQLQGDLVGADRGGAEAGGDGGRGQEAGLEGDAPDQQVPAEHELLADHAGGGAAATPARAPARRRTAPPERVCAIAFATAEPTSPSPPG